MAAQGTIYPYLDTWLTVFKSGKQMSTFGQRSPFRATFGGFWLRGPTWLRYPKAAPQGHVGLRLENPPRYMN